MTLYEYLNLSDILEVNVEGEETNEEQDSLQGKSFAGTIIVGAAGTALK